MQAATAGNAVAYEYRSVPANRSHAQLRYDLKRAHERIETLLARLQEQQRHAGEMQEEIKRLKRLARSPERAIESFVHRLARQLDHA